MHTNNYSNKERFDKVIAKNKMVQFFSASQCTSVTMSVTKDSTFAAMAGEKYKVAFRRAQWAFTVDQCISSLFFLSLYFEYDFHNK